MSIPIKSPEEIRRIEESAQLASEVLNVVEEHIYPGQNTEKLNEVCHKFIIENKAIPSPLNYKGFPKSICTSINQVVCHGIPSSKDILKEGDIINVDVTCYLNSYHGDTSRTFSVGKTSRAARDLMQITQESLWVGIRSITKNSHFGDIGEAIQKFVEKKNYSVVKEYCGHGIGKEFHEDPHVPHYGKKGTGAQILPGMVFTIEPMVNQGRPHVVLLQDNWTVETQDKKLSAQYEHTVAIREDGIQILSANKKANETNFISF